MHRLYQCIYVIRRPYRSYYLEAAGIGNHKTRFLFRNVDKTRRRLTENPMSRVDVLRMIKHRAAAAGPPYSTCCHSWPVTGITAYLENGGVIGKARQIAAHESPRATKFYNRTQDELTLDEIERIAI